MKNKKNYVLSSEKGVTLIEILAALVILGIIVVSFLTFFIQSSRTNNISGTIIDATYVAQAQIEEVFNNRNYLDTLENKVCNAVNNQCYSLESNGYHIWFETKIKDNNTHIIVQVFNNNNKDKLQAQMETILPSIGEESEGES